MKHLFTIFSVFILIACVSCTQCTVCEYYYVLPSSGDTISGNEDYCGSNKLVSDFEDFYKQDIQTQAGFAGTAAQVICTRSSKP
ncbi:MAG: hypothetical protein ACKVPJ_00620 [Chitinophagales bacterium]